MAHELRWQQRFQNFQNALSQLDEAIQLSHTRDLSTLEKQGIIHTFEYTYELAWNTLRDYLKWQGFVDLAGSRDTIREAFSAGLLDNGDTWMAMLIDRNRTSHTYNEETAEAILKNIRHQYHAQYQALIARLESKLEQHDPT